MERDLKKEILKLLNNLNLKDAQIILAETYQELEQISVIKIKEPLNNDSMVTEFGDPKIKLCKDCACINSADITIQHKDGTREQIPNIFTTQFITKKRLDN